MYELCNNKKYNVNRKKLWIARYIAIWILECTEPQTYHLPATLSFWNPNKVRVCINNAFGNNTTCVSSFPNAVIKLNRNKCDVVAIAFDNIYSKYILFISAPDVIFWESRERLNKFLIHPIQIYLRLSHIFENEYDDLRHRDCMSGWGYTNLMLSSHHLACKNELIISLNSRQVIII